MMHTIPTDKQFTGQRLDETGLYYYGARYYDATIGRFISADTIVSNPTNPQCFNRYSYCLNNPLKYVDPSGHWNEAVLRFGQWALPLVSIPGLGEVVAGFLCIAAFCSFFDCTPVWKIEPLSPEEAEAAIDDYYDSMFSSILGEDEFEEMEEQEGQAQPDTAGEVTSPQSPDPNDPNNRFTIDEKRTDHIFRDEEGHFRYDTPENRAALEECANDPANYRYITRGGNDYYTHTNPDGTQTWVWVRNGKIVDGGINLVPK